MSNQTVISFKISTEISVILARTIFFLFFIVHLYGYGIYISCDFRRDTDKKLTKREM